MSGAGNNLLNLCLFVFFCMKNCFKLKCAWSWELSMLVILYFNALFDSSRDYDVFKASAPGISSSRQHLRLWEERCKFLPLVIAEKTLGIQPQRTRAGR